MKAILLPLIMMCIGVGTGVGAGFFLKPEPVANTPVDGGDPPEVEQVDAPTLPDADAEREYAKLNNQFVIPVLEDGLVAALVVMSLNLEVTVGSRTAVFSAEPKLRDRFLQVMFDHANTGGFSGNFTRGTKMRALRNELLRAAKDVIGERVTDVLVIDIVRQDS